MGLLGNTPASGGKTALLAGGSKTILGFANKAKQRRRFIVIGVCVAAVIACALAFGAMKYAEAQAAARVVDGYSSLSACLLGAPLADGEVASVRFRQMQLTSLTQVEVKRAGEKAGPWPDRCAKYAHGLHDGLGDSSIGQSRGKGLLEASQALADALDKKDGYALDLSEAIDRTFSEAKSTGIVLQPKPDVPEPPARAQPLTLDALAKDGVITDKPTALNDVHAQEQTEEVVRFLVGGAKLCTIAASTARCEPVAPIAAQAGKDGLRLLGTADDGAGPLLFAGGGAAGIFRGADKVDAIESLGGYSAKGGFAAVLAPEAVGLKLITSDGKRAEPRGLALGALKLADAKRDAQLLWGHAVVLGEEGKELVLAAATVGSKGVGPLERIGALAKAAFPERAAGNEPRVDGCRAGSTLVARARTGRDDFVAFWLNGKWTTPLRTAAAGGTLTCRAGEAVLSRIDIGTGEAALDSRISHQRCTPTECRGKTLALRDALAGEVGLAPATPLQAVGLDGKLLMVWLSGQRGGMRLRLADMEALAAAPDAIVFDDREQGGKVVDHSDVDDVRVLPAAHFAVILMATPAGLRALRVSADGKFAPVKL